MIHANRTYRPLAVALLALLVVLVGASGAAAEEPFHLGGATFVDRAGVVRDRPAARDALDAVEERTDVRLTVVLVDSFDGRDPVEWAQRTALLSGLGAQDVVLAVAVVDRRYALAPEEVDGVSAAHLDRLAELVEAELSTDSWDAAVQVAAEGMIDAAEGRRPGGSPVRGLLVGLLVVGTVVGAVVLVRHLLGRRRPAPVRRRDGHRRDDGSGAWRAGPGGATFLAVATPDLDRRSAAALVTFDDVVRQAEDEVRAARARHGAQRTADLEATLADALAARTEAFRLRQTLDDETDTDAETREAASRILVLCRDTTTRLHAARDALAARVALESEVGAALGTYEQGLTRLRDRVEPAQLTLGALAEQYSPDAVGSVAGDLDQAVQLLTDVADALGRARERFGADDASAAAELLRAVEDALTQADRLLDVVDAADTELAAAADRLAAGIASLTSDLEDAARLAPDDPWLATHVREAEQAVADAHAARSGTGDPLTALRRLATAEVAIDSALAPLRDAADRARRADSLVGEALDRLAAALPAASLFVDTRRGAIGPSARTRLAEAQRLREWAVEQRASDPETALLNAQRAETFAAEALQLAQSDVSGRPTTTPGSAMALGGIRPRGIRTGLQGGGQGWGDDLDTTPPKDWYDEQETDGILGALLGNGPGRRRRSLFGDRGRSWIYSDDSRWDDDDRRRSSWSGGGSSNRGSSSSGSSSGRSGGFGSGGRSGGF